MTAPVWSVGALTARPVDQYDPRAGVYLGGAWLGPELTRSLGWWLVAITGETSAPADPDRVRTAIDEQGRALRQRSADAESHDFRAGLAWADHALDAVAAAAGCPS